MQFFDVSGFREKRNMALHFSQKSEKFLVLSKIRPRDISKTMEILENHGLSTKSADGSTALLDLVASESTV